MVFSGHVESFLSVDAEVAYRSVDVAERLTSAVLPENEPDQIDLLRGERLRLADNSPLVPRFIFCHAVYVKYIGLHADCIDKAQ